MKKSRSEWRSLIEEQRESGLSQSAYSEEKGVSLSSFQYWRGKFRKEEQSEPGFVEVRSLKELSRSGEIELELPHGIVLRLRGA